MIADDAQTGVFDPASYLGDGVGVSRGERDVVDHVLISCDVDDFVVYRSRCEVNGVSMSGGFPQPEDASLAVFYETSSASAILATVRCWQTRAVTVRIIWRVLFTLSGGMIDPLFEGSTSVGGPTCSDATQGCGHRQIIRTEPAT